MEPYGLRDYLGKLFPKHKEGEIKTENGKQYIFLKHRWHRMYRPLSEEDLKEPQKVQAWLEELQQLEEPRRDRHIREKLVGLWEGVQKVFSSAFRGKEEARKQYRDQTQEVLLALQGSLGPKAKERLASRYATLVICADMEEVQAWNEYLNRVFKFQSPKPATAFVRWERIPIPEERSPTDKGKTAPASAPIAPEVALIFWNGGGSVHDPFVYCHELAHVVDGELSGQRLSEDPEWIKAWQLEKGALQKIFPGPEMRNQIEEKSSEAFAYALAEAWRNPQNAQAAFPKMFQFFLDQELTVSPPAVS